LPTARPWRALPRTAASGCGTSRSPGGGDGSPAGSRRLCQGRRRVQIPRSPRRITDDPPRTRQALFDGFAPLPYPDDGGLPSSPASSTATDHPGQPMAEQYIFTIGSLTKAYGKREVLKNIWLAFYPGAKIGVIGSNGSGKSTLLRVMALVEKDFLG